MIYFELEVLKWLINSCSVSWVKSQTTLCNVAEEFTERGMKKAAIGAKEYIIKKGASEVLLEADLSKEKMNTDVSVDGSCGSRVGPRNRVF